VFRDFLQSSSLAVSLDRAEFDQFFPEGVSRADFLLFDGHVVCEVKEVQGLNVERQVRNLAGKGTMPSDVFNRYFCNSIIKALRNANDQISSTKKALALPDALGLVVLENGIPEKMSTLTLLSVANQVMQNELMTVNGVLCADMVNYFESASGDKIRLVQFLRRETNASSRLADLTEVIVKNCCQENAIPLRGKADIDSADQLWHACPDGTYEKYTASITFATELEKGKGSPLRARVKH
jgi:hypothetical protein